MRTRMWRNSIANCRSVTVRDQLHGHCHLRVPNSTMVFIAGSITSTSWATTRNCSRHATCVRPAAPTATLLSYTAGERELECVFLHVIVMLYMYTCMCMHFCLCAGVRTCTCIRTCTCTCIYIFTVFVCTKQSITHVPV